LKIVAKLLRMETWLLLTAYKKSPVPYPMVPSLSPYDLPFRPSHNTSVTDDEQTNRETDKRTDR